MKIYPKKLNSLEELRREKHVLLYAKKHTASDEIFSAKQFKIKPSPSTTTQSNILALLGDLLTSKSASGTAITLGLPLVKLLGLKAGKGIFKPIIKEVIGGYVKWKLIHFGYTTVMRMVKSKIDKEQPNGKHQ